jgi:hypothetical protein
VWQALSCSNPQPPPSFSGAAGSWSVFSPGNYSISFIPTSYTFWTLFCDARMLKVLETVSAINAKSTT